MSWGLDEELREHENDGTCKGLLAAIRDLVNGERVEPDYEAAAKAHFHYTDPDKRDWDTLPAVLQEDRVREIAVAVHAAIGDKLLVDYPTEESSEDE